MNREAPKSNEPSREHCGNLSYRISADIDWCPICGALRVNEERWMAPRGPAHPVADGTKADDRSQELRDKFPGFVLQTGVVEGRLPIDFVDLLEAAQAAPPGAGSVTWDAIGEWPRPDVPEPDEATSPDDLQSDEAPASDEES